MVFCSQKQSYESGTSFLHLLYLLDLCITIWRMVEVHYYRTTLRNKGPKRPHVVHLSRMCHLFWQIGQDGHLVRWIPFSGFRRKVEHVLANQRQGRPSCFYDQPENHNLVEDIEIVLPVKLRWIPFSCFWGEVENYPAIQRPGRLSCFSIGPKNTNMVEDVEILLHVKCRWIPFSGFRGEVENISANQRPGWQSCFFDLPKKKKKKNLVEDVEILLPVKFRWIPFRSFRGEVENMKSGRQTMDGRTTDETQRVITIVHFGFFLRLGCTKNLNMFKALRRIVLLSFTSRDSILRFANSRLSYGIISVFPTIYPTHDIVVIMNISSTPCIPWNTVLWREKEGDLIQSYDKPPIPTENSITKGQYTNATKYFDYTTIVEPT